MRHSEAEDTKGNLQLESDWSYGQKVAKDGNLRNFNLCVLRGKRRRTQEGKWSSSLGDRAKPTRLMPQVRLLLKAEMVEGTEWLILSHCLLLFFPSLIQWWTVLRPVSYLSLRPATRRKIFPTAHGLHGRFFFHFSFPFLSSFLIIF